MGARSGNRVVFTAYLPPEKAIVFERAVVREDAKSREAGGEGVTVANFIAAAILEKLTRMGYPHG